MPYMFKINVWIYVYHKNCFDLRPNRYIKKGIRGYIRTRQEVIQSIKDEIDLNWKPTPYFEKTDDYWHFEHLLKMVDAGFH
jgi:hypothetical protein